MKRIENKALDIVLKVVLWVSLIVGGFFVGIRPFLLNPTPTKVVYYPSNNCSNVPNEDCSNNSLDVVGEWTATVRINKEKTDMDFEEFTEILYLYEDGTFTREPLSRIMAANAYYGNYIVKDNKIYLNYIIGTGSGTGVVYPSKSSQVLIINEDSIHEENVDSPYTSEKEFNFVKTNATVPNDKHIESVLKNTIVSKSENYINSNL